MGYLNLVKWSDETKIRSDGGKRICGSDQVRSTKTSVSCQHSSMVKVRKGTMNTNVLKQRMMP